MSLPGMLLSCFKCWTYLYGLYLCLSEAVCCTVPISFLAPILLALWIKYLRIPPPDAKLVEDVLGCDPWALAECNGNGTNETNNERYVMRTVAHRGAGLDAPENSLSALRRAKEKGCSAVEIDVALTSDGVPIVFHDDTVDRITTATGEVKDMTWAQLKNLDISSKHPFSDRYKGERIALLDEAIQECIKLGLRVFLDLKGDDLKLVPVVLDAFDKNSRLYKTAVVSSFNPYLIYMIRRADPNIVCSMAWRPNFYAYQSYDGTFGESHPRFNGLISHILALLVDAASDWALHNVTYYILGLSAVLLQKDNVTLETVRKWKERGVRVIPWTVNHPLEKQFFSRILKITYMTDTLDGEPNRLTS
ncbi:glycerophosphodiester phosphodiesterase 1 [Schistocerca serialis cubense]|uniref:glycerophosphodiester phosphodiesterase 1 n=1 Tax=Schistocerca serialis cubense TaxID=2023355 RepID=UPI00214E4962|nr:glycerophosphodiester phosphodiesterase 1 [Schistocerca serialis cubense]